MTELNIQRLTGKKFRHNCIVTNGDTLGLNAVDVLSFSNGVNPFKNVKC